LDQIHDPRARGNQKLYRLSGADLLTDIRPRVTDGRLEFESPLARAIAMTRYLDRVLRIFRSRRLKGRGGVDPGGNENVFRSNQGHEKLALARECVHLFDKFGDNTKITSTTSGPFFNFVSHVYDFAVGAESAGEARGLADPIKQAVREYKTQMAQADELLTKFRRLRK
jgi:hypothetical protein